MVPLTIAASTFTGAIQLVGATTQPLAILRLVNDTSVTVTVSFDGTNTYEIMPTMTSINYNLATNNQPNNHCALLPQGFKIWVTASVGTGSFIIYGWYQPVQN